MFDTYTEKSECADVLRNIVTFLYENEQYGDDWSEEIETLDKLIDYMEN